MPELSRFYGIVIRMYWADHPPPHMHVEYGGEEALVRIDALQVVRGKIAARALGMVVEWAIQHRAELAEN